MQNVPVTSLVGESLGDYLVEKLFGRGKLSIVYKVRHQNTGNAAMLTLFIPPDSLTGQPLTRFKERFAREGNALTRLSHPHILPVYTCGEYDGIPYLINDYVKGVSLAQLQKEHEHFTPAQALDVLTKIATGLDEAHRQGAIHGILNPAHILITDERVLQITGFGLMRSLECYGLEEAGAPYAHLYSVAETFLGVPAYIAPECARNQPVDSRIDIYSLGVLLFEMLSGTLPFAPSDPVTTVLQRLQQPLPSLEARAPELPPLLDHVIAKATELNPAERYPTAQDLVNALARILLITEGKNMGTPTRAEQPSRTPPQNPQITLPSTIDWFKEEMLSSGKWQIMPPIITSKLPAVQSGNQAKMSAISNQPTLVPATPSLLARTQQSPAAPPAQKKTGKKAKFDPGADPFVWWSTSKQSAIAPGSSTGHFPGTTPPQQNGTSRSRRRVIALLATGGAIAALGGGLTLARLFSEPPQNNQTTPPGSPRHNYAHPNTGATRTTKPTTSP